jgi:hypothetical protein
MNISASLLLEVWEVVSELLPNNKREDMARKLINIFADKGMDRDDFEAIRGEDDHIDSAIEAQYTGESTGYDDDYDDYDNTVRYEDD